MEWLQDSEIDKLIEEAMATVDEDSEMKNIKRDLKKTGRSVSLPSGRRIWPPASYIARIT